MSSQESAVYCYAPWVYSFINTRGKRNLCCFREKAESLIDESQRVSFEDYWNSPEVRNDRLIMLKNQAPKDCYPCHDKIFYKDQPRHFFFDKYQDLDEKIRQSTDETGRTSFRPRFVDYRFSNLCNFACRMCAPGSSSKIEALEKRVAHKLKDTSGKSIDSSVRPFLNQTVLPELLEMVKSGHIDQFYWAGGEPLLTPEHWKVMKFAIDQGKAAGIDVVYNTNLSLLSFKGESLLELIRPFKSVHILASVDAVGDVGEYIRSGLDWSVFQKNIQTIKKTPGVSVDLTVTLTIPGILYLKDLLDYIQREDMNYDVHLASANGMHEMLSPFILPVQLREKIIKDAIELCESYQNPRFDQMIQVLQKVLHQGEIEELSYPEAQLDFFKNREVYLLKEAGANHKLESLYRERSAELADWWARPKPRELNNDLVLTPLENIELKWCSSLMDEVGEESVALLVKRPKAWHQAFQDKYPKAKLLNIQDVLSSSFRPDDFGIALIVNEVASVEELEKLKNALQGCELRLVGPSNSLLNKSLNLKAKSVQKLELAEKLSSSRTTDFDPISYMLAQRTHKQRLVALGVFLGRCLFWMRKSISLHSYYKIKKE